MSTTDDLQTAIEQEKARRRQSEREIQETTAPLVREATSLWRRIMLRRQQNGFGEDYEIALTRRA